VGGVNLLGDFVKVNVGNSVLTVEDLGDFLKSGSLGFNVDEVDEDEFDTDPQGVEQGEVPVTWKLLPGDWVGLVTDGQDGLDGQVHDHETLGTETEWQDLDGVGDEETRPGDGVEDTEDPDDWDLDVTGSLVGGTRVLVDGRGDGPEDEHDDHTGGTDEEEWATTSPVNQSGRGDGNDEGEHGGSNVETQLLASGGDTGTSVDQVGVVGEQGVTRVLRDDTERDENGQPPSVTLGLQEVDVVGALLGLLLQSQGVSDFTEFELDGGVVLVTGGVVVGEHVQGLIRTILVNQPSWGFWDPVDEGKLDDRWHDLEESDSLP